jgi:hypothetical protein
VDTRSAGHLAREGLALVAEPHGRRRVLNTCGFIGEARRARGAIPLAATAAARIGLVQAAVIARGPRATVPQVDALLPISDYSGVPSIVRQVLGGERSAVCPTGETGARGSSAAAGYARRRGSRRRPRRGATPTSAAPCSPRRTPPTCASARAASRLRPARSKIRGNSKQAADVLVEEASALASWAPAS